MDIEKLIERLKEPDCDECTYEEKRECAGSAKCVLSGYAAEALSTLQAENARLREELEYEREHANAYHEECGQWEAENEKLRAELEQVKRALAMMWFAYMNSDKESPHSYETEALEEAERILGPWAECMPKYLRRGPKED